MGGISLHVGSRPPTLKPRCLCLQGLPQNGQPGTVALYGCTLITMGVLKVWAAPACNNPVFAEIVPPHLRNLIYAFDRCFEGAVAACATPFVGLLAEQIFGFTVRNHSCCLWSDVHMLPPVLGCWPQPTFVLWCAITHAVCV